MRLIHTSDLHLREDKQSKLGIFGGEEFNQIIKETIKRNANALLIAGDLFDSKRPSKKVISFVKREFHKLDEKRITVFVIMGDSDQGALNSISLGKNVKVFKSTEIICKKIKGLSVYGASYLNDNPLRNFKSKKSKNRSVGLLHVDIEDQNLSDISNSGLDYLALGHYHDLSKVKSKVPCYYSGSSVKGLKYKKARRYFIEVDLDKLRVNLVNIQNEKLKRSVTT